MRDTLVIQMKPPFVSLNAKNSDVITERKYSFGANDSRSHLEDYPNSVDRVRLTNRNNNRSDSCSFFTTGLMFRIMS